MTEQTTKTYIVTFRDTEAQTGHKFSTYPVRVLAFDLEHAQEKAIDALESISMKHGEIISITRSLSQI